IHSQRRLRTLPALEGYRLESERYGLRRSPEMEDSMRRRAGTHQPALVGRRAQREALGQVLAGAQAGQSGVLVVRGEAGIGKTALLEDARSTAVASGFRVESAAGVESETQFAFAGLHQLCAPLLDR